MRAKLGEGMLQWLHQWAIEHAACSAWALKGAPAMPVVGPEPYAYDLCFCGAGLLAGRPAKYMRHGVVVCREGPQLHASAVLGRCGGGDHVPQHVISACMAKVAGRGRAPVSALRPLWVGGKTSARVSIVGTECRYALLSLAACEAALQLHLPQHASVHEHWVTLQERSGAEMLKGPYPDVVGEGKATPYGEDVVFVANDWHAGVPCCSTRSRQPVAELPGSALWCGRAGACAAEAAWPCVHLRESAQHDPAARVRRCGPLPCHCEMAACKLFC